MSPDNPQAPESAASPGAGAQTVRVLGVEYAHLRPADGGDLYLTEFGRPLADLLMPENYWTDRAWSRTHRRRLSGTSTLYRIRTKPVAGRGRDIVLKWNRMGQDVPGGTLADDLANAEFNSPFEEFALALELRNTRYESPGQLLTHKPLAIYVPHERMDIERLGRKAHRIHAKADAHKGVRLDAHRKYAVIYEWVGGVDAAEAYKDGLLTREELVALVHRVEEEMRAKGFVVHDSKAQHIIVRPDGEGGLLRGRDGRIVYASIDFELLERTAEREQSVRSAKRRAYLVRQAHRFEVEAELPPHLSAVRILGVDYVYGRIASTDGALWVVGRDPVLFDYFLPEKWRKTPRTRLSVTSQVYDTVTKDNVRLVWRVSHVGEQPDMDPFKDDERRILAHGYNSPFEEVALSFELTAKGIATIYPRAVYMTGETSRLSPALADDRRYETHARLVMPDGQHALRPNRDYILLWGYWNAPDELLAQRDEALYTGVNALQAYREGLLNEQTYLTLMKTAHDRLADVGVEDLNLRGTHLLLSLDRDGRLLTDGDGLPAMRIRNFELLRTTNSP